MTMAKILKAQILYAKKYRFTSDISALHIMFLLTKEIMVLNEIITNNILYLLFPQVAILRDVLDANIRFSLINNNCSSYNRSNEILQQKCPITTLPATDWLDWLNLNVFALE